MKLALSWVMLLFGASVLHSQGVVGSIIYHTARGAGKVVPIYGIDPLDPTYSVQGDNLALYARRSPVYGTDYWAELWVGPARATETGLSPVPSSLVHFRDDVSAIRGRGSLSIPGTLGGDEMTFQLRVWAARSANGDLINSWADVLTHHDVPRGLSLLTPLVLGNVAADQHLYLPQNLAFHLQGFGLFIVPEPHALSLLALGAVAVGLAGWGQPRSRRPFSQARPPASCRPSRPSPLPPH
ncbi:MAG: hypothetical protein JNN07_27870 [Verrucomicrobiales bacterium]|nr:hypothetical protein [Verrucomicrobiales bacterium]